MFCLLLPLARNIKHPQPNLWLACLSDFLSFKATQASKQASMEDDVRPPDQEGSGPDMSDQHTHTNSADSTQRARGSWLRSFFRKPSRSNQRQQGPQQLNNGHHNDHQQQQTQQSSLTFPSTTQWSFTLEVSQTLSQSSSSTPNPLSPSAAHTTCVSNL